VKLRKQIDKRPGEISRALSRRVYNPPMDTEVNPHKSVQEFGGFKRPGRTVADIEVCRGVWHKKQEFTELGTHGPSPADFY